MHVRLPDEAACMNLASQISQYLQTEDVLSLNGPLGSGKTTFVRALVVALNGEVTQVHSPTYTIMHNYDADIPVIHVDAYRIQGPGALDALGFSELISGSIACVEWASLLNDTITDDCHSWNLNFEHLNEHERLVTIEPPSNRQVFLEPVH